MNEKIQRFILLMVGVLAMSFAIGYLVFAWVEPGANPPQGNVPAPINVGDIAQTKAGRLGIGFFDPHYYLSVGTTTSGINAGLKITNPGSEPSLYVEDEPGDATPFVIDAAGNVGIGTSTPAVKLHVDAGAIAIRQSGTYGDVWGQWQRSAINTESFNTISGFYGTRYNWDSDWMFIGVKNEGANRKDAVILWADDAAESLRFLHARAGESSVREYMRITGDGNVGIGTSTPAYKLDVVGGDIRTTGRYRRGDAAGVDSATCPAGQTFSGLTVSGGIITFAGSCTSIGGGGGGEAYWVLSGSNLYTSSTAWNVGIGTTTPAYKLDVEGGGIYATGGTVGVQGGGSTMGGYFWDTDNTGVAYLAYGNSGVRGGGSVYGGYFWDTDNTSVVYLAFGTTGVRGGGSEYGGYFWDTDGTSGVHLAYGSWGIYTANDAYFGGNVGIGTTPSYKLDVNGAIRGNFVASDGTSCGANKILKRNSTGDAWICASDQIGDYTYNFFREDANGSKTCQSICNGICSNGKVTYCALEQWYYWYTNSTGGVCSGRFIEAEEFSLISPTSAPGPVDISCQNGGPNMWDFRELIRKVTGVCLCPQ